MSAETDLEIVRYLARFRDLYPYGIPAEAAEPAAPALVFSVSSGDLAAAGESGRQLLADAGTKGLKLSPGSFTVAGEAQIEAAAAKRPRAIVLLGESAPAPADVSTAEVVRTISLAEILASREGKKRFWSDLQPLIPLLEGGGR